MPSIDLNADLGEGMGDDAALLAVVSSANVACGAHAGDLRIARATIEAAVARGIAIGAHPSYKDRDHFGRRPLAVAPDALRADVAEQLAWLDAIASGANAHLTYVKPHGALYNTIVTDESQAGAVVDAIADFRPGLAVLGLPGSAFLRLAAQAGLRPVAEGFADRAYTAAGTLVPRAEPGAVLHDPDAVAEQAVRLATGGTIASLCLHGDTPGAVALAHRVRDRLQDAGLTIAPFAPAPA
ncbi:MAG: 5-oxoprolinase subunit PxpA [Propionibacteriaceae bacterium]|nr:5-oxoprolinase subunit PxpA [Propionibacteriaceae bacterium]